jgi:hypothetical protein
MDYRQRKYTPQNKQSGFSPSSFVFILLIGFIVIQILIELFKMAGQ